MAKRLTMTALAKECGVSRATMSAVINGREKSQRISPETAARVRDFLDQRGYVQSKSAMELRGNSRKTTTGILFCGTFVTFPHLMEALNIFVDAVNAESSFAEIICINAGDPYAGLREYVARGIDRLIWIHADSPENEWQNAQKIFPLLEQIEHVIVYNFDRYSDVWEQEYLARGIDLVGFDRVAAYRKLAEKLVKAGHQAVGLTEVYATEPAQLTSSARHLMNVFSEAGLNVYGLRSPIDDAADGGTAAELAKNLMAYYRQGKLRAAFIRHDLRALQTIRILEKNNINVPEDIVVTGFNGLTFAAWTSPSLSTITFPVKELSTQALAFLQQKKQPGQGRTYYLENILVSGQSFPQ